MKDKTSKTTNTTAEFPAQYRSPNWQKKRLEILERDKYTCQRCGDKESTLHVHHMWYEKDRDVWEYTDELITLCSTCHKDVHDMKMIVDRILRNYMRESCQSKVDFMGLDYVIKMLGGSTWGGCEREGIRKSMLSINASITDMVSGAYYDGLRETE